MPPAYLLVLDEIISSTLNMEVICSFETSVATQQTTRRYIPEDDILSVLLVPVMRFILSTVIIKNRSSYVFIMNAL
jgi:hypothetical protein